MKIADWVYFAVHFLVYFLCLALWICAVVFVDPPTSLTQRLYFVMTSEVTNVFSCLEENVCGLGDTCLIDNMSILAAVPWVTTASWRTLSCLCNVQAAPVWTEALWSSARHTVTCSFMTAGQSLKTSAVCRLPMKQFPRETVQRSHEVDPGSAEIFVCHSVSCLPNKTNPAQINNQIR